MKKIIILLIMLIMSGCSKKEEMPEDTVKIMATGQLVCAYKEKRTNDNTLYTSLYQFNFNDNGILLSAVNQETIELKDATKEVKDNYTKLIDKTMEEYKDIDSVEAIKEINDDIYKMIINIDVPKMDKEMREKYLVNYDRINTYKIFTNMGYTCE